MNYETRVWLTIGSILITAVTAYAKVIHVPADQPTIQAGINAAQNGDTVLVAPGTYTENIDFSGKAIKVTSSGGPSVTIIDGGKLSHVVTFDTSEGNGSVLGGFTVQNGSASSGGGLYIIDASPTIVGNIIQKNTACEYGGGIVAQDANTLIVEHNIVQRNTSTCRGWVGGGIYLVGGAFAQVIGNVIQLNVSAGYGGGVGMISAGAPTFLNNTIRSNEATYRPSAHGGAIYDEYDGGTQFIQNLIYGNTATSDTIYFIDGANTEPTFVNNTIVGGARNSYTIVDDGSVDSSDGPALFYNNLLLGIDSYPAITCPGTNPPLFENNDAYSPQGVGFSGSCAGEAGQNGNLSEDPLFVSPTTGNYQLQGISPVIDAGTTSAPDLPTLDLASHPRIVNGTIGMGAYEYSGSQMWAPQ